MARPARILGILRWKFTPERKEFGIFLDYQGMDKKPDLRSKVENEKRKPRQVRKSIYMLVFALLWFPAALNGHYVHITLYNAPEGYLSNSDEIIPRGFCPITRVTDAYRLYYFQIHEDTGTLILFGPENDWEQNARNLSQLEFEKFRDQYVLQTWADLPKTHTERSEYIAKAFASFFAKLVKLHPQSEFGVRFRGHGGGGGELMGSRILPNDAFCMLKEWNRSLGRKLLNVDMGWPCKKGSFSDLVNFSPFTKYYYGTDLNNGGYNMDDWTYEKYKECNPPIWEEWAEELPYLDRISNALKAKRKSYEYSRNNMVENKTMQSLTCFDCEKFLQFADAFQRVWGTDEKSGSTDVKEYLETKVEDNERILQLFNDCIVGTVNNKDFFEWPREANGMYKFNARSKTYGLVVDEPEGGVIESFPKSDVYLAGSDVDLIATPREGYVFEGWSGDARGLGHEVLLKVDGDLFVSASFSPVLPDEAAAKNETAGDEETPVSNEAFAFYREDGTLKPGFENVRSIQTPHDSITLAWSRAGYFRSCENWDALPPSFREATKVTKLDFVSDRQTINAFNPGLSYSFELEDGSTFTLSGEAAEEFVEKEAIKNSSGDAGEHQPPDFTPEGSPDDYREKWEAAMARIGKLEDALLDANAGLDGLVDQLWEKQGELAGKDEELAKLGRRIAESTEENALLKGENERLRTWGQGIERENAALRGSLAEAERILSVPFTPDWFFVEGMGWLWTGPECYPWIYSSGTEGWLFYESGTSDPWRFYDYEGKTWVAVSVTPSTPFRRARRGVFGRDGIGQ